jgi:hypothetical protein
LFELAHRVYNCRPCVSCHLAGTIATDIARISASCSQRLPSAHPQHWGGQPARPAAAVPLRWWARWAAHIFEGRSRSKSCAPVWIYIPFVRTPSPYEIASSKYYHALVGMGGLRIPGLVWVLASALLSALGLMQPGGLFAHIRHILGALRCACTRCCKLVMIEAPSPCNWAHLYPRLLFNPVRRPGAFASCWRSSRRRRRRTGPSVHRRQLNMAMVKGLRWCVYRTLEMGTGIYPSITLVVVYLDISSCAGHRDVNPGMLQPPPPPDTMGRAYEQCAAMPFSQSRS